MEDQFTYQGSPIEPWTHVVHLWLGSAVEGWVGFMYPPRNGGFWILGGWLLGLAVVYVVCKSVIFLAGMALLCAAFVLTSIWDLVTYPVRRHYGFS